MKTHSIAIVLASALAATILVAGCTPAVGGVPTPAYQSYLYMTDTNSGKIYAYDPTTHKDVGPSIATTGKSATGEIAFYKGIGYVAVGFGTDMGVFYFDPSIANPSFTKISGTVAAQFIAFFSPTKAYVSTYGSGLYSFNPSSPSSGLSNSSLAGTSGLTLQEVIVGSDGYVYAADSGNGNVLRIDPVTEAVTATISTTLKGTTGLFAGHYNGILGIFAANEPYLSVSPWTALPGSIDFIPLNAINGTTATLVANATSTSASIFPARLVQLSSGNIMATDGTGGGNTYFVTLLGATATVTELKNGSNASFGSYDIAYKDGLVYVPVPDYSNYPLVSNLVYIFDESGTQKSYSPVPVMSSSDAISNIGFYE